MHLVLVAIHLEPSPRSVPLGSAMLASVVKQAFPDTVVPRILDLFLQQSAAECAAQILALEPHWVGFSIYLWNRAQTRDIARILRAEQPSLLLFAGGAEPTADPDGVFREGCWDFVLPGEGEELILEVLGKVLKGVSAGEIRRTVAPGSVKDLATLPSPYLVGTLDPRAYSGMLWELSRGCPFRCDFCFESRGTAGTRRVPMARVKAELKYFEACGVSQVFVLDPTFNFHKAQAKAILRLIAAEAPAIHFFFEIRSEFIDEEMAQLFAALRCSLQIGLQSADDAVLRHISRSIDREDFEAKVLLLHQAGAPYGFDLIYGLPGDSLAGFQASLDFGLSLAPNHLDIFPLSVLPGTRLQETAPSFGLQYLEAIPYTVLASPTFSAADMAAAGRIAHACDLLYNQGKAVPWFALLLDSLGWAPSLLFNRFADYLETHANPDITALQVGFFTSCLLDSKEAAIAADIVAYFGYSGALLESASLEPMGILDVPETWLETHARLVSFHHDPWALLDHLESGITALTDLALALSAQPCEVLLFVQGEASFLEVLTPAMAQALDGLRQGNATRAQRQEALGFLKALAEI